MVPYRLEGSSKRSKTDGLEAFLLYMPMMWYHFDNTAGFLLKFRRVYFVVKAPSVFSQGISTGNFLLVSRHSFTVPLITLSILSEELLLVTPKSFPCSSNSVVLISALASHSPWNGLSY